MSDLDDLITELLSDGELLLDGLHRSSGQVTGLVGAVTKWCAIMGRSLDEVVRGYEPSIRQSILMTLIPSKAVDPSYKGSYEAAIKEHIDVLGISLNPAEIVVIRDLVINIRKLSGMTSAQARRASAGLGTVKSDDAMYRHILKRQNSRCMWCGAELGLANIRESLEHIVPKHIGDDPVDGSNWGLACMSCNKGKADHLAWSANAYAHDFVSRSHFHSPEILHLEHRWVVLRRSPECDSCQITAKDAELFVYKRVATGLAIPSNCSVTCEECAVKRSVFCLPVSWHQKEKDRNLPTV
jgi:hypothetical protein